MAVIKTDLEKRLYAALKRITQYDTPERLRNNSLRDYGLDDPGEAIEYSKGPPSCSVHSSLEASAPS